jgi:ABC-type transporter Mla subunit MlaD
VAWTWSSFQAATASYRQLLASGRGDGQSFLQLWTGGFDGTLPTHYWLPNVALGSVALIAASITLVLVERLVTSRAERDWNDCATRLVAALTQAQAVLNARQVADPIQAMDALEDVTHRLLDTQGQVRDAVTSLQGMVVRSFDDAAVTLLNQFQVQAAAILRAFGDGLQDTLSGFAARADQIGQAARVLGQATGASESAHRALADAAGTLAGEAEAIRRETTALSQNAGSIGRHLAGHTEALQHQVTELQQIRAGLARLFLPLPGATVALGPPPRAGVTP